MPFLINKEIKDIIDICNNTPYKLDESLEYKYYIINSKFYLDKDFNIKYQIIRKKLNSNSKIPLYILVGISNNSLCNNLSILNNNIDKIKHKYNEIIFILYDQNIKKIYEKYFEYIKNNEEFNNYTDNTEKLYAVNDKIKFNIASHCYKIIKKINKNENYNNIDLLGVSFGGGVCVFLSHYKNLKINNLILVAPAIFEGFKNISKKQKITLGWCIQDEKVSYKLIGKKLIYELYTNFLNKTVVLTDLDNDNLNEDITHRLQNQLFDVINN
jgi:hypothetical protein